MAFGRMQSRDDHAPIGEINVTPMVDVMLVLLVIFLLTAPLMMTGVPLDLPVVRDGAAAQASPQLKVYLDPNGVVHLDEKLSSLAALPTAFRAQATLNPDTELFLYADRAVSYGDVMLVVDVARQAGLSRVVFLTRSEVSQTK